jgi:hypothetical protein
LLLGVVLLAASSGCTPSEPATATAPPAAATSATDRREIEALRAEVARLSAENARLRLSPSALAAEVEAAVAGQDAAKAQDASKRLATRFPYSAEAGAARKRVDALMARLVAAEEERKRLAALGFRGLKTSGLYTQGDTTLRVMDTGLTRRWTFDSYGHGWRYLEPEKGQRIITARVMVTSNNKDPALFGIGAYVADGATMRQVGTVRYRFARWQDFGAYLGTHADFRNDFSHTGRIPFSVGVAVSEEDLKRRPLYLVVTREGCHKRLFDRQLQPPMHYVPGNCASLKKTLGIDDFKDGTLAVLKRID